MSVDTLVTLIVAITGLLSAIPAIILALHNHGTINNDIKPSITELQNHGPTGGTVQPPAQPPVTNTGGDT